ncbi:DUF4861 family protein [Rudanella paleaurantiibacter]|nr:DUF4861 family protein [Rudanella paleaurantiibacter]
MFLSHLLILLLLTGGVTSVPTPPGKKIGTLQVSNASAVGLTQKAVRLGRKVLGLAPNTRLYPVLLDETGQLIPAQLDDTDADGQWDELFWVMDIPAKTSRKLMVQLVDTLPVYPNQVRVRFGKRSSAYTPVRPLTEDTFYAHELPIRQGYQPYQTDGPTWENDKVGFRHYFDGRNAKDLFGKRSPALSPDSVGLTPTRAVVDNYHVLRDWGRDVLPVGNAEGLSLGLGGVGLQIGNELYRVGVMATDSVHTVESSRLRVLASGPVRAALELDHRNWKPRPDRDYRLVEQPTIWPGMYAYQNTVQVHNLQGDETLLIGLPRVATPKSVEQLQTDDWVALFTHDKQSYNREHWLGLAIVVPRSLFEGVGEAPAKGPVALSYYARLNARAGKPLTYYALGSWELSDPGFRDPAYFREYLRQFMQQIAQPVAVKMIPNSP